MLDRIAGLATARFQVVSGQIGFEVDRWWHTGMYNGMPRRRMTLRAVIPRRADWRH
jgi:hypothetical protein